MRGTGPEGASVYVRREAFMAPDNRPGRVSGPEGASVYARLTWRRIIGPVV